MLTILQVVLGVTIIILASTGLLHDRVEPSTITLFISLLMIVMALKEFKRKQIVVAWFLIAVGLINFWVFLLIRS